MKSGNPIGKMTGLCMIGIIFFTISCNSNSHLEHTLEQAGERRAELEKVLSHYENDSLKKQAAEFLISNLVGKIRRKALEMRGCLWYNQTVMCLALS